jgi:hypothetical protein
VCFTADLERDAKFYINILNPGREFAINVLNHQLAAVMDAGRFARRSRPHETT